MGQSTSQEQSQHNQQQPPNQNPNQNPQQNQLYSQIYQNQQIPLSAEYLQFHDHYHAPKQQEPIPVSVQQTKSYDLEFSLSKKNIVLVIKKTFNSYCKKKQANGNTYYLTFIFNCKSEIVISIYYLATEFCNDKHITEKLGIIQMNDKKITNVGAYKFKPTEKFSFPPNVNLIDLGKINQEELIKFSVHSFPLIIKIVILNTLYCQTQEKLQQFQQQNIILLNYINFKKTSSDTYEGKILRQKLQINGKAYIFNEIYGISQSSKPQQGEGENCSICLTDPVDTIIIPCKHMCVCSGCCQDMRVKTNKCPICRKRQIKFQDKLCLLAIESFLKIQNQVQQN